MSIGRCILGLVFATLVLTNALRGQGLTGQISGTVQDQTGAAVASATVALTNEGTSQTRTASSDASGAFLFPQLLNGNYRVTIAAAGFKKYEQTGIVLTSTERLVMRPIQLQLGSVNESLSVTALAETLETQSAERSSLLSAAQVMEAPSKGRNYLALLNLLPGVVNTSTGEGPTAASDIRINGSRYQSITLNLDGVPNLDPGGGNATQITPPMDSLAEIKVLSNSYQAEYGRSYGGIINTVTKSGTGSFHGGAYDYFRNEALNANNFFNNRNNLPRPLYRFNFFGYFIGGPVLIPKILTSRDKLFFFWSQEFDPRTMPSAGAGQTGQTGSGLVYATFPTALELGGNFSQTLDTNGKLIPIQDPLNNKAPFPGNIIPPVRIDAAGQALLGVFPKPNIVDPGHTYNTVYQGLLKYPNRVQILRVDYNISPKNMFYTQMHLSKDELQSVASANNYFDLFPVRNTFPLLGGTYKAPARGFTATLIHTFTPNIVNETTFGINRFTQSFSATPAQQAKADRTALGIAFPQFYPQNNPLNVVPNATFGGVQNAPSIAWEGRFPFVGTDNDKVFSDNVSMIFGSHNVKVGIYIERLARNATSLSAVGQTFPGTVDFSRNVNNPLDTNYAFSNALLGSINNYQESDKRWIGHGRAGSDEPFVQDNWKVTKRLTLDLGLRFHHIIFSKMPGMTLASFEENVYSSSQAPQLMQPYRATPSSARVGINPVTGETVPAALIGALAPGSGQFFQGMKLYTGEIMNAPSIVLAPRFGFALDVFGNAKTAIRGGFGMFPGYIGTDATANQLTLPPLQKIFSVYYTTISDLTNYAKNVGSAPIYTTPGNTLGTQHQVHPPTTYNYSFGIQQDLGFKTMLDVAYVGSVSRHLQQIRSINATPYGTNFLPSSMDQTIAGGATPLPAAFLRPYRGFADISINGFGANANYNSTQTQVNRRFRQDFIFGVAWTWSKVMDITDTNVAVNPFLDTHWRNYGKALFDQTHTFVANFSYNFPKVSRLWNNRFARTAFDDWELFGIASFLSGMPNGITYSLVSGADITGATGAGVDTRVVLTGNPVLPKSQQTDLRAFNTDVVTQPSFADFGRGTAPKDVFRGPGNNDWDLTLVKTFPFGKKEARHLDFKVEAYNAFNHTQFSAVSTAARFDATGKQVNTIFGQYTLARDSRRLQLALKFYF